LEQPALALRATAPRSGALLPVFFVLFVLAVVALWYYLGKLRDRTVETVSSPVPLVSYPGIKTFPSLSPGGQQVAFSWNGGEGALHSIYEKEVGSEQVLRLTNAQDSVDIDPVWSPDGREIAFARLSKTQPGIFIVSALGGPERKVRTTLWGESSWGIDWGKIDWAPDGRSLVFSDREHPDDPDSLFLLSLDTLAVRRLTSSNFQTGDVSPRFSPDGRSVAYIRDMTGADPLFVIPVEGGPERLLSENNDFKNGIAWTPDGRSLVFGGISGTRLSKVNLANGHIQPLAFGQDTSSPSIRGTRMAFAHTWETFRVVRVDLEKATRGEPKPLLASTKYDSGPQYSPDGTKIAFESSRNGSFQVWSSNVDGTGARQLTNMKGTWTGTPRWSPDGTRIAFDSREKGDADIYLINADGGPPRAFSTEKSNEVVPSWSRDGKWIYFASDRTGRWEVFKQSVEGKQTVQVTHGGGFAALESPDGGAVYYTKGLSTPGLWKTTPNGGKESELLKMPDAGYWGFWTVVENGIYYLDSVGVPQLRFMDLKTGKIRGILEIREPARQSPGLGISPDGRTLLYTQRGEANNEVDLVDNFH
jgi:Tol biopolymer transport system component